MVECDEHEGCPARGIVIALLVSVPLDALLLAVVRWLMGWS